MCINRLNVIFLYLLNLYLGIYSKEILWSEYKKNLINKHYLICSCIILITEVWLSKLWDIYLMDYWANH